MLETARSTQNSEFVRTQFSALAGRTLTYRTPENACTSTFVLLPEGQLRADAMTIPSAMGFGFSREALACVVAQFATSTYEK